eukprot:CAMPEP_0119106476 /NCGR_PEP_ID=MMETSP1180-20130426/4420_1 /TAXON_ID=3052 ORGANISM="Chlamydomonas cf sp, Strain CCMP681" /NCGR_SAMPLE_ID=MMETSP1180 /ASSEMBLY_ACC=CAM_ASM_000741 /LENGTH=118 /DNA_ID=CAMNT_0007091819 /DNA_START=27 /DNA_END=383 /DNA_ORIENTATION=+
MALMLRTRACAASMSRPAHPMVKPVLRVRVVTRVSGRTADQKAQTDQQVEDAIKEADETCESKGLADQDCQVAWDQAEELLSAKSKRRVQLAELAKVDPLEAYCREHEDENECRVYDD